MIMGGDSLRLEGKKALVTAAGQGIGRAVAVAFARAGATVLATDVNAAGLDALDAEGHVELSVADLDVTDTRAIRALGAAHAGADTAFDVLFNCAGIVHSGALLDCPDEEQARIQGTSVETVREQFIARQPMGRLGRAEEIAALAVHLASDESAFTTGAIHVIDGGWCN
jgi:NAD(P)-dependent dehydrogenase (short-subunit alcohol dehydrogenase family)